MTILTLAGICVLIVASAMAVLWAIQLKTRNAGIVDVGWSMGVALCALIFAVSGPGWSIRRFVIAAAILIWGLRLATHILFRMRGQEEDARYTQLRREWGDHVQLKFLGFFELQALLALIFSSPALVASWNLAPEFSWLECTGLVLWLIAVFGEATADRQLENFKKVRSKGGKQVCDVGLWRYSRHPNYFFEFLLWLALALFAAASAWGWLTFLCPLLMLFFLFKITGIPATEAQALRSKGEAYRQYQRTTSAFIPWFPKKD
jgi:steroid 5-alpha reductase family enzyme